MCSDFLDALNKFRRRTCQKTRYQVGDVMVENPVAAGDLEVTLVLSGEENEPGYNSQPVGYAIKASYKGRQRWCRVPASHDGVQQFTVSSEGSPRLKVIGEPGYQLTEVRLTVATSDDPLRDSQENVILRLVFTYNGPTAGQQKAFKYDFDLL